VGVVLNELRRVRHRVELVLHDDLRPSTDGVDHDVKMPAFAPDVDLAHSPVLRRPEEAEHGNSRTWEALEQPGDGVGVEQLLSGPRLCPQQIMLEGVEKRQHTFEEAWLDSFAGKRLGRRRGRRHDGSWWNRRVGEQRVEREIADRVG
jgi:hypothetical protein